MVGGNTVLVSVAKATSDKTNVLHRENTKFLLTKNTSDLVSAVVNTEAHDTVDVKLESYGTGIMAARIAAKDGRVHTVYVGDSCVHAPRNRRSE